MANKPHHAPASTPPPTPPPSVGTTESVRATIYAEQRAPDGPPAGVKFISALHAVLLALSSSAVIVGALFYAWYRIASDQDAFAKDSWQRFSKFETDMAALRGDQKAALAEIGGQIKVLEAGWSSTKQDILRVEAKLERLESKLDQLLQRGAGVPQALGDGHAAGGSPMDSLPLAATRLPRLQSPSSIERPPSR